MRPAPVILLNCLFALLAVFVFLVVFDVAPVLAVGGLLFLMAYVGYNIATAPGASRRKQWLGLALALPLFIVGPLISLYFLSFEW